MPARRARQGIAAFAFIGAVAALGALPATGFAQQMPEPASAAPEFSQALPTTPEGWARYLGSPPDAAATTQPAGNGKLPIVARAGEMLSNALSLIGVRYRYGGTSPESGFDCSGLVRWTFMRTWGVVLPHRASDMADIGSHVGKEELKPGDLVFFNSLRRAFSHVGIYLGDGRFVHAPASGGKVRIDDLGDEYWSKHWNGARRMFQGAVDPAALGRLTDDKGAKPGKSAH
ncbi:C40 family peptidase [Derxia lacustris]|uniref:C40 family peptidase n=1 Tax=Derxia lacustris TaxID=764842 RepID=UPI001F1B3387|nr:C40 family peptidase [Derxia lacustris]